MFLKRILLVYFKDCNVSKVVTNKKLWVFNLLEFQTWLANLAAGNLKNLVLLVLIKRKCIMKVAARQKEWSQLIHKNVILRLLSGRRGIIWYFHFRFMSSFWWRALSTRQTFHTENSTRLSTGQCLTGKQHYLFNSQFIDFTSCSLTRGFSTKLFVGLLSRASKLIRK